MYIRNAAVADLGEGGRRWARQRSFGLDLIRCAAVLLVLQAHDAALIGWRYGLTPPQVSGLGGLFGVDLFFGLSGFLIGRLLFAIALQGPGVRDWLVFMVRRWMRTVPLYLLWLLVLLVALPAPADWPALLPRYLLFSQNLAWPMPPADWFSVSWSLAVEEWFYLGFSAVFLLAATQAGFRRAPWLVVALFIAVPIALRQSVPSVQGYAEHVLHVVVTRLDAIGYGVVLAGLWVRGSRLFRHPVLAGAAGAGLIWLFWGPKLAIWLAVPPLTFLNAELVANGIGVCLLVAALAAVERAPGWLARPVRMLSNMSYALYLTHLTFAELVTRLVAPSGIGRGAEAVLIVVVPFLAAYASWRWFEAPILARRPPQHARPVVEQPALG